MYIWRTLFNAHYNDTYIDNKGIEGADIWGAENKADSILKELEGMTDDEIRQRTSLIGNDISVLIYVYIYIYIYIAPPYI